MLILSPDEILQRGLVCAGFADHRRLQLSTRLRRFKAYYGSPPVAYANLLRDLQLTREYTAQVEMKCIKDFDLFLICLHFLKCYRTEHVIAGLFERDEKTIRKWIWFFACKLQAHKKEKVNFVALSLLYKSDTLIYLFACKDFLAAGMAFQQPKSAVFSFQCRWRPLPDLRAKASTFLKEQGLLLS